MHRMLLCGLCLLGTGLPGQASEISGTYMEARTCQVYTGPCFANGEVGLTGHDAVMAWRVLEGKHQGVDLKGLSVAVIMQASKTIGFEGVEDADRVQSVVLIDERASAEQHAALLEFAKANSGKAGKYVKDVRTVPISLSLDFAKLTGKLQAGEYVELSSRKAVAGDCICSNESAYYPPLTKLQGAVPGVTIEGNVRASSLGSRWSIPDTRTSFLGTFRYQ